ncbi:hypothetical protein LC087_11775 [Bacillus carboniphilus]|uniref:Uncharacterized protein n=1 Tax=Bacillus carboniphilus TaxID=86663 RepID=A0ABY9JRX3_9BACI|nr:hypothetical protein [Bacillus carboniphilus]WLR41564.1 hypothetical protein LC087_11775 [Bacillus carboniphilus]
MLLKIFMLLIFLYTAACLLYTSVVIIERKIIRFKELRKNSKGINNGKIKTVETKSYVRPSLLKEKTKFLFPKLFLINSVEGRDYVILGFALSTMLLIIDTPLEDWIPKPVLLIFILIFFYGLAKYFHLSIDDPVGKFLNLLLKWFILLVFVLSLVIETIDSLEMNVKGVIVTIIFSIAFSLILIMNVLKDFKSRWFQVLNIFIGFFLILFAVGITFGLFYLENNEIFKMYSEAEYSMFIHDYEENVSSFIFLIYNGLVYFYTFPDYSIITLEEPLSLVAFFEFIVGFLFNVVVIGFLISYFVSILFSSKKV